MGMFHGNVRLSEGMKQYADILLASKVFLFFFLKDDDDDDDDRAAFSKGVPLIPGSNVGDMVAQPKLHDAEVPETQTESRILWSPV